MGNGRADAGRAKPSPTPPTPATESPPVQPPPAKKQRLKLNAGKPDSNKNAGDTIRVSTRAKRKSSAPIRYEGEMEMVLDDPKPPAKKKKQSPAPSSGLSSLESAPQSEREESPFIDPPAPSRNDYGDFMSFYVAGGDDEDEVEKEKEKQSKAKGRAKSRAKSASKPEPQTAKQNEPTPVQPPAKPVEKPAQAQQPAPHQPPQHQPAPAVQPPVTQPQRQPPQHQRPGPPQYAPAPFPMPPPMHRGPPLPPQPPRLPQPIINFIDVIHDAKPTRPDNVAEMVQKLQALSSALTNFGGVPAIPPTPPQDKVKPLHNGPPKPVFKPEKPAPAAANEADFLLSHFNFDDDDDSSDEGDQAQAEVSQRTPGHQDGPLTYGVEFIQNALKSWAQQRMTHQVTQQWQAQQQHQLQQQQLQAQRRGPGRPRRYDEPSLLHGPPPIIHMDLAQTPEGVAIKKFQSILDSACLQVNAILPIELSRALRHLYMQIDHLINQGPKNNENWQPMSYGAQIKSHKAQVDRVKENDAKAREEVARQQQIANQHMMEQLNLHPPQVIPSSTGDQDHALELERRRSKQHAQAQPYISQQHLNPLQLGPRSSATPTANGPSPPPSRDGANGRQPAAAGSTTPAPGPPSASAGSPIDGDPNDPNSKAGQVHLDKMKLYMPGFLPRSGQSMKFSFAPHSDAAVRAFGTESFPTDEPGSSLPNRGPMSAPPGGLSELKSMGGDAASPIQIDSDTPAEQAFGTDEAKDKSNAEASKKTTPVVGTGGFNAINAPAARPSSVPAESPDTIVVAMKHPSGALSASASPSISKTTGVPRVTNFPV
ncbi:hypothetical protein PRZ48_001079 [Zasmidium cellare]|uniref:Uncharacterized protein n=1 Tax=Zasmidium cellare TaxID=395010 RepID=A0ABR0F190_ZASCE|nr:hypothetical protein PRZ48_001079 [Zasmidium cellare]